MIDRLRNSVRHYFTTTQSLLYAYLISLPLLLCYEFLVVVSQPNSEEVIRISVDVWFRTLLSYVSQNVISVTLILVALLGIVILYRERNRLSSLSLGYFGWMVLESSVYAIILAVGLSKIVGGLLQMLPEAPVQHIPFIQQFALSLGAGIYEELFFRVILVSALLFIFKRIINKQWVAYGLSAVIAALLFSAVHFFGAMGDSFSMGALIFRFLFGLALNAIYIYRGFGVAAWTHALYDLLIITLW